MADPFQPPRDSVPLHARSWLHGIVLGIVQLSPIWLAMLGAFPSVGDWTILLILQVAIAGPALAVGASSHSVPAFRSPLVGVPIVLTLALGGVLVAWNAWGFSAQMEAEEGPVLLVFGLIATCIVTAYAGWTGLLTFAGLRLGHRLQRRKGSDDTGVR